MFCLKCSSIIDQKDEEECPMCNSRSFIYGDIIKGKQGFICTCDSTVFKKTIHMDYTNKAVNIYRCQSCGNQVETVYYRTPDEIMLRQD